VQKCLTSARARDAARKARDLVIRKSALESLTLPGKLADCSDKDSNKTEMFIVEGDSAGGSAKQGRDRHFQAILPLRGKILNTERARLDKILGNEEIKSIISALGTGIGDNFDLKNLRYGRVIIMTDADVDGSHIRTLLLTFFFRYMPQIIENGHMYIAQPPLYRITHKGQGKYVYTDAEKDAYMKELGQAAEKAGIQRYKGLGEMNPTQLWETTMNPETRTLLQVSIEDAAAADKTFDMLMGAAVPPRTRFITTHAHAVRNLDI
jgi:DNA gyrase subunit B